MHIAKKEATSEGQLQLAGTTGAARELYEETGIDVRSQLARLVPAILRSKSKKSGKDGVSALVNEYKHRLFFFLMVTDSDFPKDGIGAMGSDDPKCKYKNIKVRARFVSIAIMHSFLDLPSLNINLDLGY